MFGARKVRNQEPSAYATRGDFCRIFQRDMSRLYLLSFLLTGDEMMAEQCFVGGLHVAQQGNLVFKEWAESWARRTIILNAIRMVRPRLTSESMAAALDRGAVHAADEQPEIARILDLPVFERFVFVMTVLEGYPDHECSLHLTCSVADIRAARTRAFEQIGRSTELRGKLMSITSGQKVPMENAVSGVQMDSVSGMAATA